MIDKIKLKCFKFISVYTRFLFHKYHCCQNLNSTVPSRHSLGAMPPRLDFCNPCEKTFHLLCQMHNYYDPPPWWVTPQKGFTKVPNPKILKSFFVINSACRRNFRSVNSKIKKCNSSNFCFLLCEIFSLSSNCAKMHIPFKLLKVPRITIRQ